MSRLIDDCYCSENDQGLGESENVPGSLRVLIVEDDSPIREILRELMLYIGHRVIGETSSGREAVEMTCALRPDIVLMDIELFCVDGLEATRQIQECCPTPAVALSAYAMPELPELAERAGAMAYLSKPFIPCDLERAMARAIARFEDMADKVHPADGLHPRKRRLHDGQQGRDTDAEPLDDGALKGNRP
ncbi:MAG: response regulator [Sedimentisphaerales bacterium]|nr:response regulator [Sedimentisphaerales bacterium]